jgi:UDP-2,4-diacetamido-2,4,6-trideoxy-beta-L-altropyranose hydrolase
VDVNNEFIEFKKFSGIIIDGYNFDNIYFDKVISLGLKLIIIDDKCINYVNADIIINHNLFVNESNYQSLSKTKLLVGLDYVLLQKEFYDSLFEARMLEFDILTPVICFGGADPLNITESIIRKLDMDIITKVNVITGNAYSGNMNLNSVHEKISHFHNLDTKGIIRVISESNFAICSASGFAYECLALYLPLIVGYYVDHQKDFYSSLAQLPNVYVVGSLLNLEINKINKTIRNLSTTYDFNAKKLFDGQQPVRYRNAFIDLFYN